MNTLEAFEYVKTFIARIRKDKAPKNLTLCVNMRCFTDNELAAIMLFEAIIIKLCKLEKIVYNVA